MGSPYFSDFDLGFDELDDDDRFNNFLDLYSNRDNENRVDDSDGNVDDLYYAYRNKSKDNEPSSSPDDSNTMRLRELYSSSGSMDIRELYKEHLAKRPKSNSSSLSRLRSAIASIAANNPNDLGKYVSLYHNIADSRYKRAHQKWTDEGRYIDDLARMTDSDKNREIGAIKFDENRRIAGERESRIREDADLNRQFRMDTRTATIEDRAERNIDRDTDREERAKDRAERNADRDVARADRLEDRAATRADKAKPTPSEQKTANDLVDQHIYRSKPDLFEFEDDYGKPLSKPRFIGNEVDATNLMAVRRNLLRKVLSGGVF